MGVNYGFHYTGLLEEWFDKDIANKFANQAGYSAEHPYTAHIAGYYYYEASMRSVDKSKCSSCMEWSVKRQAKIYSLFFVPYEGTGKQIDERLRKCYKGQKTSAGLPLYNSDMNWKNHDGSYRKAWYEVSPEPKSGSWGRAYSGRDTSGQSPEYRKAIESGNAKEFVKAQLKESRFFEYGWGEVAGRCATEAEIAQGSLLESLGGKKVEDWKKPG